MRRDTNEDGPSWSRFMRQGGELDVALMKTHDNHRDLVGIRCARKTHGWKVPQCFAASQGDGFRNILGGSGAPLLSRSMRQDGDFDFHSPKSGESQASTLLADAELGDHTLVALGIVFLEIVEQATPLADQHEKSAA